MNPTAPMEKTHKTIKFYLLLAFHQRTQPRKTGACNGKSCATTAIDGPSKRN